jgi:hypothetical protein
MRSITSGFLRAPGDVGIILAAAPCHRWSGVIADDFANKIKACSRNLRKKLVFLSIRWHVKN